MKDSRWVGRFLPIIVLFLMMLVFQLITKGQFMGSNNLKRIIDQALVVGTVATGAVFIFSAGSVNIAMGASTAVTATLATQMFLVTNSLSALIATAVVVGVAIMIFTCIISAVLKVQMVFVTISMMGLLAALNLFLLNGATLTIPYALISTLRTSNVSLWLFLGYFLVAAVLFHFTSIGRTLRFIGTNPRCARLTGFNGKKFEFIGFGIAGFGIAFGVFMNIIRTGSVNSFTANTLNMDVMLAIVLGGMEFFGGTKSRIYAGIVGALTVTVLNNGLLMSGVPVTLVQGIRGFVFLLLILASQKRPDGLPTRQ